MMVTRKPLPPGAKPSLVSNRSLPYPTSPTMVHGYGRDDGVDEDPDFNEEQENAWVSVDHAGREDFPAALRAGPPVVAPTSSVESHRAPPQSTNPYIRRQLDGQNSSHSEEGSAAGERAGRPVQPLTPPPPQTISKDELPTTQFAGLGISEQHTNPWQSSLDSKTLPQDPPSLSSPHPPGRDNWSTIEPSSEKAPVLPPLDTSPLITLDSPDSGSPAWDEDGYESAGDDIPPSDTQKIPLDPEENAWADSAKPPELPIAVAKPTVSQDDLLREEDGWLSADALPKKSALPPQSEQPPPAIAAESSAPEVVPDQPSNLASISQDGPQTMPSGSTSNIAGERTSSVPSPNPQSKSETYEIKKITWHDVTTKNNPRVTPILTQNANGPCPLLALVNALTLSTPAELNTALVETLRSREQVSLGLLLDAVFDELMSGRRGDAAQELPDVGDLYAFLLTLHTGMNVNPRFLPYRSTTEELRRSLSHVHPSERDEAFPGTFEETREMKLYSTFSIPLIHGWVPPKDSIQLAALKRSANSYEDAQNLMFREEELEEKLQMQGLSFEEQATLEDIATIRAFFASSATQLTPYGLDVITKSMRPGSIAILFRNDHFSTLYKHPDTCQLLQLVTDHGYAGHDEIVWESLVDVNGENCEFFSGDFRLVGGAAPRRSTDDNAGWTTVSRRGNHSHQPSASVQSVNTNIAPDTSQFDVPPVSPNHEQEDHDLALALQLQEEEEERHREETARRRRESELSQQYIEQQASSIPPRGSSTNTNNNSNNVPITSGRRNGRGSSRTNISYVDTEEVRPNVPPRRNNNNNSLSVSTSSPAPAPAPAPAAGSDPDDAPPSYEAAARQQPFSPPLDHPAHPSASPNTLTPHTTRRSSAYSANSAAYVGSASSPTVTAGRSRGQSRTAGGGGYRPNPLVEGAVNSRRTASAQASGGGGREKECVLM